MFIVRSLWLDASSVIALLNAPNVLWAIISIQALIPAIFALNPCFPASTAILPQFAPAAKMAITSNLITLVLSAMRL